MAVCCMIHKHTLWGKSNVVYACLERGDDVVGSSQQSTEKGGIVKFIVDCMLCFACLFTRNYGAKNHIRLFRAG